MKLVEIVRRCVLLATLMSTALLATPLSKAGEAGASASTSADWAS